MSADRINFQKEQKEHHIASSVTHSKPASFTLDGVSCTISDWNELLPLLAPMLDTCYEVPGGSAESIMKEVIRIVTTKKYTRIENKGSLLIYPSCDLYGGTP